MARYFAIANGPRGCYMPDNASIIRCATRRELKAYLEMEAYYLRDAGFVGASRRNVARLAAAAWREAHKTRPDWREMVLPLAPAHSRDNYCYGLGVSIATRADYREENA